jgi:tetratricopeptide (TPR) repeat protein
MLSRSSCAALLAALFLLPGLAQAAPADDLKEGSRLYQQGKLQPALDKINAVLAVQPRDPQARFLKGLILTEQKKTPEAIAVFTGLTEDYPELPEPYNNLAVLYASQGNYDKAKSSLELAIHTHPSYATAHENLGDVYAQLASRAYDRALQLDKNNAAAQVKLAMVKDLFVAQKSAAATAKAEPAKPDAGKPSAKAEAPAKAEAAVKLEAPAKAEAPAKVEAPAKAETPAKPDKPAAAAKATPPGVPGDGKAAITAVLNAWAAAWSAKDVKGYLSFYAPDFETPGGESREAWEKMRAERIEKPKSIEVSIKVNSVVTQGNEATAVVVQGYKSDTLKSNNTKTFKLVKVGDKWLIKQERVGG